MTSPLCAPAPEAPGGAKPGPRRLRVAMLTSEGDQCGIAAYSRALAAALPEFVDLSIEPIHVGKQDVEHYREEATRLNRADVIHIQHEHSFWGGVLPNHSAFWNLRYLLEKPVVVTAHTTTALRDLLRIPTERRLAHRIAKEILVRRSAYRDSVEIAPFVTGHCIVHTREGADALIARGANPKYLHVIPAGVPEPAAAPTGGVAFRQRFGLTGRRVITLFGYLAPNKGYGPAMEALGALPADVALVFAGGPRNAEMEPFAASLREQIVQRGFGGRVVVTGYLTDDDLANAMAATDIAVAPHTQATGSYSVTVPLAYGLPVVASDLACFREIEDSHPCLRLFRAGDTNGLATALGELLESADARAKLAYAAREYADSHTWRAVARKTAAVYEEAVADAERLAHHGTSAASNHGSPAGVAR